MTLVALTKASQRTVLTPHGEHGGGVHRGLGVCCIAGVVAGILDEDGGYPQPPRFQQHEPRNPDRATGQNEVPWGAKKNRGSLEAQQSARKERVAMLARQ